jgi:GT2 family glycosyltransferase
MKLSIIIPVYNNWNFTKTCLKDLAKLPYDHEVILIDNGSTDTTRKSTSLWTNPFVMVDAIHADHPASPGIDRPKHLLVIKNKENKGFSKACNQGFIVAAGDYVLFLNNDIKVKSNFEDWTQALIQKAEETGGLVGPTGGLLDSNLNFIKETSVKVEGNFYMSGWCLCAKHEVFQSLVLESNKFKGPFTEEFGLAYFEDTDLGFRAEDAGIPMEIVPVPVMHFGKMTSRKINLKELYLGAKIKFINKWASKRMK